MFLVQLLVRRDPRKGDDNPHLIMYSNWQHIMDEAGMSMDKVLRFKMVEEKVCQEIKYTLKFVDVVSEHLFRVNDLCFCWYV
ncbi:hypothetical protein Hanom_Chr15g01412161 [Helianthus anomalus]